MLFRSDGRIAEDFKLSTGTWVSVGPLRGRIIAAGSPYVQDAIITGIDQDHIGAMLVVPWDHCRGMTDLPASATAQQIAGHHAVRSWCIQLLKNLAQHNLGGSASQIQKIALLTEPLSIDKGEITDKGSVNQRAVLTHRSAIVQQFYTVNDQQPNQIITLGDQHV